MAPIEEYFDLKYNECKLGGLLFVFATQIRNKIVVKQSVQLDRTTE